MPDKSPGPVKEFRDNSAKALAKVIVETVTTIPQTSEPPSAEPAERARAIQTRAALRAAAVSGSLALPSGPYGIALILPDLMAVWRIQAQMVADIAGAFGKSAELSKEHLLYCLFRHAAAQLVRDLTARVGERVVFRRATLRALQTLAQKLGIKLTQRVIANSLARWVPVVGSVGVAGYAYYDTKQVGTTALELLQSELGFDAD